MTRRKRTNVKRTPIETLELFSAKVDELRDKRLVQRGMHWEFILALPQGDLRLPELDKEEEASFYILFRQFWMPGETVHIPKACGLCRRLLTDDGLRHEVGQLQSAWKNILGGKAGGVLVVNGLQVKPDHALDLLFAGIFHSDDLDKAAELERLRDLDLPLFRLLVLNKIDHLTWIILSLGNIVRYGLSKGLFAIPP